MSFEGTLGFVGLGNMGTAILNGLLESETVPTSRVCAFDVDTKKTDAVAARGAAVAASPEDLASHCDAIVLAVKPQDMGSALESMRSALTEKKLLLSIAAGISIAYIQDRVGAAVRVIRAMPNTPALVRAGAAGYAASSNCTAEDAAAAGMIFSAVGIAEKVPEESLDAVTALSGSGPAYFFLLVECMIAAGAGLGLPKDQAARLATQTFRGAGLLLDASGESPETLRRNVTSKGGTTEAALTVFERREFKAIVKEAMDAAARRSSELGQ